VSRRRRQRLPADPVTVVVTDLAHDGRGVGRSADGKAVFVHGALPGETVRARLFARSRKHDEGQTVEVVQASPDRVETPCPWFDRCGGCVLQHLAPAAQRHWKHKRLVDNLTRIGQVEPGQWLDALTAEPWWYRRRARLSVRLVRGKGRVLVGFREPGGRFVAELEDCRVLDRRFGERLLALSELVGSLSVAAAVPQIEVAAGDDGAAMILRHLDALSSDDLMRLKAFAESHSIAVYLQAKGPDTVTRLWPPEHRLSYRLDQHAVELEFDPQQFIQVNASINAQLIDRVIALLQLSGGERVLDLFCGLGNFSLPLARHAATVVGVEGLETLVEQARLNARANAIENASFEVADLGADVSRRDWAQGRYDAVLIDPPRTGAVEVLPLVAASGADRVVYVSCNPATLARDAGELVRVHGFRLQSAGIADMFPHTAHVESVALFARAS